MILAIDSSSVTASCALVLQSGMLIAEAFQNSGLTHSQTLAPMIETMLINSSHTLNGVKVIAVSNGPGSFTGLRIGVAAALGFGEALDIPCVGVSPLEAAAYSADCFRGVICAAMDARRGELYSAMFRFDGSVLKRLCPDRAAPATDVLSELPAESCCWVGDAAAKYARARDFVPSKPYVTAFGVALTAISGNTRPADKIVYLRLPQAERERLEKESN